MRTAIFLPTEQFNQVLDLLKKQGWKVCAEYLGLLNKGIDFDFYILKKNGEEVLMAWDNWGEGAVKAGDDVFYFLEKSLENKFRFGTLHYFEEDLPKIKKKLFRYFWR